MIKIADISKSYGGQILFDNLSFTVNPGEKVGLVGRNGHGKTTLLNMIRGTADPDSGSIDIPAQYRIGHLEQHICFTQQTVIAEGCRGLPAGEEDDRWKVEKILFGLGFTRADMDKSPAVFSGGYQIRLNLAKVLVSRPDLLLLDEPNNYLDIVAIRWLTGFLAAWKGELLLITHDRAFMDAVVTHTVAIHRQKARKVAGDTAKVYEQLAQEEEVYEKTRLNDEKKRKQTELFISRFRAKARLGGLVQSRVKCLAKQEQRARHAKLENLEFSFTATPFPAGQMLAAHNLSFSYTPDGPLLVDRVSFTIGKRERICVIGKNGRGKSTLLKLLAAAISPTAGNIKRHPVLSTAYFCQTNTAQLRADKTIFDEIIAAAPDCLPQRARDICGAMMFSGDAALKKIGVLSGGEKSRVLLGQQLVTPAHLLLLDEPTNHLDLESCEALMDAIDDFDGSVVMVTHNERYLHRLAERLIVFDKGAVTVFNGAYQDFLDAVGWEQEDDSASRRLPPAGGTDKKALKRARAELLQERSRALRPVEETIRSLEQRIQALEQEYDENTRNLVTASTAGDAAAIAALSQRHHAIPPERDALYHALDDALQREEALQREFTAREQAVLDER